MLNFERPGAGQVRKLFLVYTFIQSYYHNTFLPIRYPGTRHGNNLAPQIANRSCGGIHAGVETPLY